MTLPSRISGKLVSHVQRSCAEKIRYSDEFGARAAGRLFEEQQPAIKLFLYPCEICRGYHLTRSSQHKQYQAVSYDFDASAQHGATKKLRRYFSVTPPKVRDLSCLKTADETAPNGELLFNELPSKSSETPSLDLSGVVNGDLTAIHFWGVVRSGAPKGAKDQKWVCLCKCGMYTIRSGKSLKKNAGTDRCGRCASTISISARSSS